MKGSLSSILKAVDRVVVITIESAADRQKSVRKLLDDAGVPFEFHFGRDARSATIGQLVDSGEYDPAARQTLGRPGLTPAEVGCALSHRQVAEKIASGPDERVLILEDDLRLIDENIGDFEAAMQEIPPRWDLAYFGYSPMNLFTPWPIRLKLLSYYPIRYLLGSEKHNPRTIARIYRRPLSRYWMRAGWFNDAHAYALNRKAAAAIAESQRPISLEADLALNYLVRFSRLDAVCLEKPVFAQDRSMPSLIGARPSWK